jgi:hypothetical protein
MSEILGRAYAIREALDALIQVLEDPAETVCDHPLDKREYLGDTMGNSTFRCGVCKVELQVPNGITAG